MACRIPTHRPSIPGASASDRHRLYDHNQRDPESAKFYNSVAWRKLSKIKRRRDPLCEECKRNGLIVPATIVHHVIEVRDSIDHRLDLDNLVSLCQSCHSRLHAQCATPAK